MRTAPLRRQITSWWWLSLVIAMLTAGCGSGNNSNSALGPFTPPTAPQAGKTPLDLFYVVTDNYFFKYASQPFVPDDQFTSWEYPVPVAYQSVVTPPQGFILSQESEQSIQLWGEADPRVAIVSGVPSAQARINVYLVNSITYGTINDIIGLTKMVGSSSNPQFQVYVSTVDPVTQSAMANIDIERTLTHELGHAFGLGHSPDVRDVMYYQSNSQQGQTPRSFLTFGDAMAIYTTLNNRHINWVKTRPVITPAIPAAAQVTATKVRAAAQVTDAGGIVVCVYTK